MQKMFRIAYTMILSLCALVANAQFCVSHVPSVHTPQMMLNDEWGVPAVMVLGSDDVLHFSFDEMSHTFHRYTCRVTHCNADGSPSDILEMDYLDGFNDFLVDDWENSHNTTQLYTRYSFSIPNDDAALKLSGNYRVDVYDDEDGDSPVVSYEFAVVEPLVGITATVSGDTDTSYNNGEQQLSFVVDYARCNVVSPAEDIKPVVFQNRRRDNAVMALKPAYMTGMKSEYVHDTKLIFGAGNEYRRFELTDPDSPGMNVEDVIYHDGAYHALLYVDAPRYSYSNYRDENGRFFVNTIEGRGSLMEADYVNVHFALDAPYRSGGNYYLIGDFCGDSFGKENMMVYDEKEGYYFTSFLLKLGVYNYMYAWVPDNGGEASLLPAEGEFYNTDNEYLIYIYHRAFGERYDKLVGFLLVGGME